MQATLTLTIIALLCGPAVSQPENQTQIETPPLASRLPDGPADVPMEMSYGKPAVEVLINGRGPFLLLVDTGASPTLILNSDLASELGLKSTGTSNVGDPLDPEAIEVQVMHVDSLELGGAAFSDIKTISWDRSTLYSGDGAPRGIIGFPLFRDVLVTFDYPNGTMRVEKGNLHAGEHVVEFSVPNGIPNIPFTIEGEAHVAHIDSGSMGALMLPMHFSEGLALASAPAEVGHARTVNSEFTIYAADYGGSITLAGHEIKAESLTFTDLMPMPNIGSQVLNMFAVTFDQDRMLARFDRNEATPTTIKRQRGGLGIKLGKRGSDYVVAGTLPDSPAAAADLREGDVLNEVNGLKIADLAPGDFAVEMRKPTVELTIEREGEQRKVRLKRGG
jgi:hypothetical protein